MKADQVETLYHVVRHEIVETFTNEEQAEDHCDALFLANEDDCVYTVEAMPAHIDGEEF